VSHPLPTHEVVAVFPAEIKAGVVHLPVRMHGELRVIKATPAVVKELIAYAKAALDGPQINPLTGRPARYNKSPAATQPVAP
jgi:hypothetical protein